MTRTKLSDRQLPAYTKGEEIFNMVSHIVGVAVAVAALVLCVVVGALHRNAWSIVGGAIFGATMICLYTMSSIYHGLRPNLAKKVFQVMDHCMIYFLIAGTYTPITLSALRPAHPVVGWVVFGIVWGFCVLAATLNAIDLRRYRVFSMICYIGMGWCILFFLKPTLDVLSRPAIVLLVAGGVAYTIGAILFGLGKKWRYMHSIFHLFVLAGSVLHTLMILLYVMTLPA